MSRNTPSIGTSVVESESNLPTYITQNKHEKFEVSFPISPTEVFPHNKKQKQHGTLVWDPCPALPPVPIPRRPVILCWSPPTLCFDLHEETVVNQLNVLNSCGGTIYVRCCGLWNERAKLGASWKSYPRRRFRLAPGIMAKIFVSAIPREFPSPVPVAYVGLQLAAAHVRDNIIGNFMVPVNVKFRSYLAPRVIE